MALVVVLATPPGVTAERPIAAFTSYQYWSTDDGGSVTRLGWPAHAVWLVGADRRMRRLPTPDRVALYEAALAPGRDLVAYSFIRWGADRFRSDPSDGAVIVADLSGHEQARFPGGRRFQWNPDGSELAVAIAHHDSNWSWTPQALEIWRRSAGRRTRLTQPARDMRWGTNDTLFVETPDGIAALDRTRRRLVHTAHRGTDVSPDGRFSLLHDTPVASGARLFDDRDGLDLSHCSLVHHGAPPLGGFQPFWLRTGAAGHLMCITIGDGWTAPPRQAGLRTGLFDPRTLEMVASFPGMPVVPTVDQRGVVVVRGDTVAIEPIADAREPARGPTVRLRMVAASWGRGITPLGTWIHEVAAGEWVPDHTYMMGACGRNFRIARIVDPDHVELEIPAGAYTIEAPGVAPSQGGRTPVSRTPTRLSTNSTDGGYRLEISIAD